LYMLKSGEIFVITKESDDYNLMKIERDYVTQTHLFTNSKIKKLKIYYDRLMYLDVMGDLYSQYYDYDCFTNELKGSKLTCRRDNVVEFTENFTFLKKIHTLK
jgi:hypothetical protein